MQQLFDVTVGETDGDAEDAALVEVAEDETVGETMGEAGDAAFAGVPEGEAVDKACGRGIGRRRGHWAWVRSSVWPWARPWTRVARLATVRLWVTPAAVREADGHGIG